MVVGVGPGVVENKGYTFRPIVGKIYISDMPSTAGSIYKPRPMAVGVGEQQQRRAMGDSSHYEEIALIGNGI